MEAQEHYTVIKDHMQPEPIQHIRSQGSWLLGREQTPHTHGMQQSRRNPLGKHRKHQPGSTSPIKAHQQGPHRLTHAGNESSHDPLHPAPGCIVSGVEAGMGVAAVEKTYGQGSIQAGAVDVFSGTAQPCKVCHMT